MRNPCRCETSVPVLDVGGRSYCRRCGGLVTQQDDYWGLLVAVVVLLAVALYVLARVL